MKLLHKELDRFAKTPLVVSFVPKGKRAELPEGVKVPAAFLRDFGGEFRKTSTTYTSAGPAARVLLVGMGVARDIEEETFRRVAALAVKLGESMGCESAAFYAGGCVAHAASPERAGRAIAEGVVMGSYGYIEGKSKPKAAVLKAVTVYGAGRDFKRGLKDGQALGEANTFTRDLQNKPGNQMRPRDMAAEARKLAKRSDRISCKVLDEKAMDALGMGLLLGVSQGSVEPARLIHLVYKPKGKAKKNGKVALVGKGLTFDAGGISLKPSSKMDDMRYDMSGGAAVLGVFHALASVDVPWEVHGIVPSSENLIDGNATKPGDIHTAMNGLTVEILNTDAEGRLILADALAYTEKKVKPDTIIDLATLTGAVVVGLGHELSGMFPTTDKLRDELLAAGEETGELVWPLPLLERHKEFMKGVVADLRNISSPAMGAGSTAGAAFLASFVDPDTEWCHLDIAGTAWGGQARDWVGGAHGSGVGTRLLMQYLETRK
ncbi:MAG: leucyl aminopeptidase [Chlamydiales bacterium]|jgi:leucyl aminopeptidase